MQSTNILKKSKDWLENKNVTVAVLAFVVFYFISRELFVALIAAGFIVMFTIIRNWVIVEHGHILRSETWDGRDVEDTNPAEPNHDSK